MSDAPRRWLDSEIPSDLRDALRSAEGDGAHAEQLARLQAKLEQAIGPGFGGEAAGSALPESSSGSAAVGGGSSIGGTLAIATALIVGLGAFWYATRTQPAELAASLPTAMPTPTPAPIALPPPVNAAPQLTKQPQPLQPSAAVPRVLPTPRPSAAVPRALPAPRPVAQGSGLMEELRQLEAIRRRLPSEPERALGAIAQHARRFPQGALGPERELLRIEALQRLGRVDEARRAAEKALAGEHPYAVQIRQLMAASGG